MDLNLFSILYLFLRLAPFIIVCFFVLSSIFNQDLKGLVFLAGLLLCFSASILLGNAFKGLLGTDGDSTNVNPECKMLTINGIEMNSLTFIPLSQNLYGYTLGYLFYFINTNKAISSNIPTLCFFPALIVGDGYWNLTNGCYDFVKLFISLAAGMGMGAFWGMIISTTNSPTLGYFTQIKNGELCSVPAATTFRCKQQSNSGAPAATTP